MLMKAHGKYLNGGGHGAAVWLEMHQLHAAQSVHALLEADILGELNVCLKSDIAERVALPRDRCKSHSYAKLKFTRTLITNLKFCKEKYTGLAHHSSIFVSSGNINAANIAERFEDAPKHKLARHIFGMLAISTSISAPVQ